MTTFSLVGALETLSTSIPEWDTRLDKLSSQTALRQIELSRLLDNERPPTRSIKNKGSTESLRPKDDDEKHPSANDLDTPDEFQRAQVATPKSNTNGFSRNRGSVASRHRTPQKASSNPHPSADLPRQSSQTLPAQLQPDAVLRKRKTESLASNESVAPAYRTRSMIIVYYDSTVQTAFEDLVKFVSGSRNNMRKGKMAAKMAEMKRAAEMEIGSDDDNDDDNDGELGNGLIVGKAGLTPRPTKAMPKQEGESPAEPGMMIAADADSEQGPESEPPKLTYVSTQQMGPSRIAISHKNKPNSMSVGFLSGFRRAGDDSIPDIFEVLDKGLEWCQAQCEHAAHQFLREGNCATEIANIKKRLNEVRENAEKELVKLKVDGATDPSPESTPKATDLVEERPSENTVERPALHEMNNVEVDMEVDDESVDDFVPPKLVFKRSKDIGR